MIRMIVCDDQQLSSLVMTMTMACHPRLISSSNVFTSASQYSWWWWYDGLPSST